MRHKLSISIEEDTILGIQEELRSKTYRSKSHFFEIAAIKLIENTKNQSNKEVENATTYSN